MKNIEEVNNFRVELEYLLNKYNAESNSETPDFILAEYLSGCLVLYNLTLQAREAWYGREVA